MVMRMLIVPIYANIVAIATNLFIRRIVGGLLSVFCIVVIANSSANQINTECEVK